MKSRMMILSLFVLVIMCSCNNLKHFKFTEDFNTTATLPHQAIIVGTSSVVSPDIPTNIAALLKQNNTRSDLVESAKLDSMTLTITAPAGQNFAFLQGAHIFIVADGQSDVEIAYRNNVSDQTAILNMDIDDVELKTYLLKDSFQMKIVTTNGQTISSDLTINIHLKVRFEANVLAAVLS